MSDGLILDFNKPVEDKEFADAANKAKQVPEPVGWHILCAVPPVETTFDGGIAKSDETIKNDELLTTVLFVVSIGKDCYTDIKRYPNGPWCKEGDFVLVRPNAGTRVVIHGKEFRLINEDTPEAVVEDPRGIKRKFI
jgi:co-chaperonin GroES (HSP10)